MTKSVRLDEKATEELEAAAEWYEARRDNLGFEFSVAIGEALERIAERPHMWPLARTVPARLNVRRLVLKRFPYAVVYLELIDEIRVIAVAHTSRKPNFWLGRLRPR